MDQMRNVIERRIRDVLSNEIYRNVIYEMKVIVGEIDFWRKLLSLFLDKFMMLIIYLNGRVEQLVGCKSLEIKGKI